MKKFLCVLLSATMIIGCSEAYDDTPLWDSVNSLEGRVEALEELCRQMNTNISAMQTIVDAVQDCDYVTGVAPVTEDGEVIGYTISFYKHDPVTIYHGEDGKDGADGTDGKDGQNGTDGKDGEDGKDGADGQDGTSAPVIGVRQDTDGNWYWTADGEWLRDGAGQKVRANGSDGQDGQDGQDGSNGQDGTDGQDGQDGITPQLKIEDEYWYVSYDKGETWSLLGKASGGSGSDGIFTGIDTSNDEYIVFMLRDGTRLQLPTWYAFESLRTLCNQMNTNIQALQTLVEALQSNDYITSVSPLTEAGKVVGYTITFAHNAPIVIYHGKDGQDGADGKPGQDGEDGKDGQDGHSPEVSIRQHDDGNWYWVLDGDWLLDAEGEKVRANGKDGADGKPGQDGTDGEDGADGKPGQDGEDGQDGADGKDGVTPQLKIENGRWLLSLDNGTSWTDIGQATGQDGQDGEDGKDGKDGDSMFSSVTNGENEVTFVLANGTSFSIPKDHPFDITFDTTEAIRFSLGSSYRIGYTLTGADASTQVEAIAQDGLKATVETTDETTGAVVVKTPLTIVERSTVIVLLSDGRGKMLMKALNFIYDGSGNIGDGVLIITTAEPFDIAAAGGTVEVPLQTNINYRVEISDAARTWLTQMPATRAALREETLTFRAEANTGGLRRAFVYLIDLADESIAQTLCITQQADETLLSETISFVDPNFEAALLSYDQDQDGKISKREALNIRVLNISGESISDLTGIEWLTNLTELDCSGIRDGLTTLDLSGNTALKILDCSDCGDLVELDLSKNLTLEWLNCRNTSLKTLDLSKNKALVYLDCYGQRLTSLDLSNNPELLEVNCHANNLRSLDVSGCPKLIKLDCGANSISLLDLSACTELQILDCYSNALVELDLSNNTKLTLVRCYSNKLTSLNVSANAALTELNADYNPLTSINLGTIPDLRSFDLTVEYSKPSSFKITAPALVTFRLTEGSDRGGNLQNVDFSSSPALENMTITGVKMKNFDFSVLPKLKTLYIQSCGVTSVDLQGNPQLSILYCNTCSDLTTLDISKNTALTSLTLSTTNISSLDLSVHKSLNHLSLYRTESLTYLNLGDNSYIPSVDLYNGASFKLVGSRIKEVLFQKTLSHLDVTECPALESLNFTGNMETVDLSGNSKLKTLECDGGTLETLDLSHNPELVSLNCGYTKMKSLNVTQCPLLKTLTCAGNYLETLDVSGNPALTSLNCSQMPTLTTLFMAPSQRIRYITYERSSSYIPDQTEIEYR